VSIDARLAIGLTVPHDARAIAALDAEVRAAFPQMFWPTEPAVAGMTMPESPRAAWLDLSDDDLHCALLLDGIPAEIRDAVPTWLRTGHLGLYYSPSNRRGGRPLEMIAMIEMVLDHAGGGTAWYGNDHVSALSRFDAPERQALWDDVLASRHIETHLSPGSASPIEELRTLIELLPPETEATIRANVRCAMALRQQATSLTLPRALWRRALRCLDRGDDTASVRRALLGLDAAADDAEGPAV
jgi:hypothetical protein